MLVLKKLFSQRQQSFKQSAIHACTSVNIVLTLTALAWETVIYSILSVCLFQQKHSQYGKLYHSQKITVCAICNFLHFDCENFSKNICSQAMAIAILLTLF